MSDRTGIIERIGRRVLASMGEVPVIWAPQEGPQHAAFHCTAEQVGYGGAAGGGKTDVILGKARLLHSRSLVIRRTYPELTDNIIARSLEFYGERGLYNGGSKVWEFPDEGKRRITFRSIQHDKDLYRICRGPSFDFIGIDEATTFPRSVVDGLTSRLRTVKSGQGRQMLLATNPGGQGHVWYREMFAPWLDPGYPNPAVPGEIRYFIRDEDGREVEVGSEWRDEDKDGNDVTPISRTFFPAKVSDNKYLGEDYVSTLNNMPEPQRSIMLYGDWTVHDADDEWQLIPTQWINDAERRKPSGAPLTAVGIDPGRSSSPTAKRTDCTSVCFRFHNTAYVFSVPSTQTPTGDSAVDFVLQVAAKEGFRDVGRVPWICDAPNAGFAVVEAASKRGFHCEAFFPQASSGKRTADGSLEFYNQRAQIYYRLREAMDPINEFDFSLPQRDSQLAMELRSINMLNRAKVQIEQKDLVKAKIGRSPDLADSLALTFYEPDLYFDRDAVEASIRASEKEDMTQDRSSLDCVIGCCGGRTNGLCAVTGVIKKGKLFIDGEFFVHGQISKQADMFDGERFLRGFTAAHPVFMAPSQEGAAAVYSYEFDRLGITLFDGFPDEQGLASIENLLGSGRLVIDPKGAPRLVDALKMFRSIADKRKLDDKGDRGRLTWQGSGLYVRALCDVAMYARDQIEDQGVEDRPLTPIEIRERMHEEATGFREASSGMVGVGMSVFDHVAEDLGGWTEEEFDL